MLSLVMNSPPFELDFYRSSISSDPSISAESAVYKGVGGH